MPLTNFEQTNQSELGKFTNFMESHGVERQPMTPITKDARIVLEKRWGISKRLIDKICNFTSNSRYGNVLKKVEELAKSKIFVEYDPKLETNQNIIIPLVFDVMGKGMGQCVDISLMWLAQAELTGLIEELNQELDKGINKKREFQKKYRIVPYYQKGRSRTHFCLPGSTHFWTGLSLVNDMGIEVDSILIDAAFQTISTPDESLYVSENYHQKLINPKEIKRKTDEKLRLGWIVRTSGGTYQGMTGDSIVLGMSEDKKFAFELGFFKVIGSKKVAEKDSKSQEIVPFLILVNADGGTSEFFLEPGSNDLVFFALSDTPSNELKNEMISILTTAAQIPRESIDKDPSRIPGQHTISFG